jgi:hypothetical protein
MCMGVDESARCILKLTRSTYTCKFGVINISDVSSPKKNDASQARDDEI